MRKLSRNLETLREFGNIYSKEEIFRPPPVEIEKVTYDKNSLIIGRRISDNSVYKIDLKEACRMVILGATRCLPLDTLVKTKNGYCKIQEVDKVLSYNFKTNKVEEKETIIHEKSFQKIIKIRTKFGIITCSHNHKFPVMRDGKVTKVQAKDLLNSDKLLQVKKLLKEIDILEIITSTEVVEMIDIEVKDNHNFILENDLLSSNSGKSFLMREMIDRIHQTDRAIVFLNDCKDELKSSLYPVQSEFAGNLLEGETPTMLPIVTLRPTFFKPIKPDLPKDNHWYSIDMRHLSKADFFTMLNSKKLTATQRISMDLTFTELQKRLKADKELKFSLELIDDILESIEELTPKQVTALKYKFKPLEYSNFINVEFKRSIVDMLNKGYVPSINLESFDLFGEGSFSYPETLLSVVLREVIEARISGKIKPLWVFIDEASRFLGAKLQTSLKLQFTESVDLHTKYFVNYCIASQIIEDVPLGVLKQSKYIFVPATADVDSIKYILSNTGIANTIQIAGNDARRLKRKMMAHEYSWAIINRMRGTMDLIMPLSPLSKHTTTDNV